MTDKVEIVVFNDKSYVRFSDYEKLEEELDKECNELLHFYQDKILNLEKENEQLKEKIKNVREKLFNLLSEYEIGNYDNNIHQFYNDVYDIHNELMELAE